MLERKALEANLRDSRSNEYTPGTINVHVPDGRPRFHFEKSYEVPDDRRGKPMWLLPDTRGLKLCPADIDIDVLKVRLDAKRLGWTFQWNQCVKDWYNESIPDDLVQPARYPTTQPSSVLQLADGDRLTKRSNMIAQLRRLRRTDGDKTRPGRVPTPDPWDPTIPKRDWERRVQEWLLDATAYCTTHPEIPYDGRFKDGRRRTFFERVGLLPRCAPGEVPISEKVCFAEQETAKKMGCLPYAWSHIVGMKAVARHEANAPTAINGSLRCLEDWREVAGYGMTELASGIPPKGSSGYWFIYAPGSPHATSHIAKHPHVVLVIMDPWAPIIICSHSGALRTQYAVLSGMANASSDRDDIVSIAILPRSSSSPSSTELGPLHDICAAAVDNVRTTPPLDFHPTLSLQSNDWHAKQMKLMLGRKIFEAEQRLTKSSNYTMGTISYHVPGGRPRLHFETQNEVPDDWRGKPMWLLPDLRGIKNIPCHAEVDAVKITISKERLNTNFQWGSRSKDVQWGIQPHRFTAPVSYPTTEGHTRILQLADGDRNQKRANQIDKLRRTHPISCDRTRPGRVLTPDPYDAKIPKRDWERRIKEWLLDEAANSRRVPRLPYDAKYKDERCRTFFERIGGLPRCAPSELPFDAEFTTDYWRMRKLGCVPFAWTHIVGLDAVLCHEDNAPPAGDQNLRCLADWRDVAGYHMTKMEFGVPPRNSTGFWFIYAPGDSNAPNLTSLPHVALAIMTSPIIILSYNGPLRTQYEVLRGIQHVAADCSGIVSIAIEPISTPSSIEFMSLHGIWAAACDDCFGGAAADFWQCGKCEDWLCDLCMRECLVCKYVYCDKHKEPSQHRCITGEESIWNNFLTSDDNDETDEESCLQQWLMDYIALLPAEDVDEISHLDHHVRDALLADGNCTPLAVAHWSKEYRRIGDYLITPTPANRAAALAKSRTYRSILDDNWGVDFMLDPINGPLPLGSFILHFPLESGQNSSAFVHRKGPVVRIYKGGRIFMDAASQFQTVLLNVRKANEIRYYGIYVPELDTIAQELLVELWNTELSFSAGAGSQASSDGH
ncbi:MAG: hypothetical protein VX223_10990, partial [Myxococcota bacterium]|nr:hypothetical protein [Myxococcota bacterium]